MISNTLPKSVNIRRKLQPAGLTINGDFRPSGMFMDMPFEKHVQSPHLLHLLLDSCRHFHLMLWG